MQQQASPLSTIRTSVVQDQPGFGDPHPAYDSKEGRQQNQTFGNRGEGASTLHDQLTNLNEAYDTLHDTHPNSLAEEWNNQAQAPNFATIGTGSEAQSHAKQRRGVRTGERNTRSSQHRSATLHGSDANQASKPKRISMDVSRKSGFESLGRSQGPAEFLPRPGAQMN